MAFLDRIQVELRRFPAGSARAYLLAAGIVVVATLLRIALDPLLVGVQFITFFPAIIVATLFCGVGAGVFATALCGVAGWAFVLQPRWSLSLISVEQAHALGLFLVIALMDVLIVGALRAAITRHRALSATLEQRVAERTRALTEEMRRREDAEAQLRQAQKAEAIGQLTGGVAHEFNNLLMAVIGNLDLLLDRVTGERERALLDRALGAAERGARLTAQLLAFARRQRLAPQPVDLNAVVRGAREMLAPSLGGRVGIALELADDLWPALVDPSQAEMVLVNLAVNARDAMAPGGGTITIRTGNVAAGSGAPAAIADNDCVVIAVSDTGTGMSADVKARAFDPFFTTKPPESSGLGLSQVHGVVTQSGGAVEIDTAPGKGTTVRVYLPRAAVQLSGAAGRDAAAPAS